MPAAGVSCPFEAARQSWPPDYVSIWAWRQRQLRRLRASASLRAGALEFYRTRPVDWLNHWVDTYDPRNAGTGLPARIPLVLFERQRELVEFLQACVEGEEDGLIEKCRDMGATWVCCGFSVWTWLFIPGSSIGWGSRKEQLVDRLGDPDSIFEKLRRVVSGLPEFFLPAGFKVGEHLSFMRIVNPGNGASITGEAGDNIGRGGRKLLYFKDESAHYERPEKIEAALSDTTRVQVDISSVNGLGNVFHRRREAAVEWKGGAAVKGRTNLFVMDWRDHPAKDAAWYETRRAKAEANGLLHIFAQEIDRNYAASVQGVIIPNEWVKSAIDAHIKLGLEISGQVIAGLDVADEGGDKNALVKRRGPLMTFANDWGEGDIGQTTRRAVAECREDGRVSFQYDCVGIGAGVKSEANRLRVEGLLGRGVTFSPWSAGAKVERPDEHVEPGDDESPLNKDFYANLKAQGWWELRRRFERTHRAVTEGLSYNADDLVAIPSDLPRLRQLEKELSQATITRSTSSLKLMVNKTPEGTKSPNLADATVMAYWPVGMGRYTLENV